MYKIISKILSTRFKRAMENLISICQPTFIPHRQILDRVLVINEVLDFAKWNKREFMWVKVDLSITYKCISKDYIRDIMQMMKLDSRWLKWMDALVF